MIVLVIILGIAIIIQAFTIHMIEKTIDVNSDRINLLDERIRELEVRDILQKETKKGLKNE